MKPRVLIPVGYGLNCQAETGHAFELAGAEVTTVHMKELFSRPAILSCYHLLALVGGFSYGDHVAAGKILANQYRFRLGKEVKTFIDSGKLIYAECNGFQALAKSGILPGLGSEFGVQTVTLVNNDSGVFEDRWVNLTVNKNSNCVFTRGMRRAYLPVRHGEGKFVAKDGGLLDRLRNNNQIVMQYCEEGSDEPTAKYPQNPNGSVNAIAGICDPSGLVFGLMPHPTAYLSPFNHPHWTRLKAEGRLPEKGGGVRIFENAIEYVREALR
jgi:phosphoribosylformylglycinamidine synthase I